MSHHNKRRAMSLTVTTSHTHATKTLQRVAEQHFGPVTPHDITIDGFVSSNHSFHYVASFTQSTASSPTYFRFATDSALAIESAFILLYHAEAQTASAWNKARFTLNKKAQHADIKRYFDPDFYWIETLDPEGEIYKSISVEDELAIHRWEGIPPRHDRPWHPLAVYSDSSISAQGIQDNRVNSPHKRYSQ